MATFIFIVFLIVFAIIVIGVVSKKSNKSIEAKDTKQNIRNEKESIDAYKIYSDWCKNKNETPIAKEEFDKLVNAQGKINIADVMSKHNNINPYQKEEEIDETKNDYVNEYDNKLQKEAEERKKRDEQFVTSTIIGYVTNSTTKGTLFGGSLLGGMFGDYINKKPKK